MIEKTTQSVANLGYHAHIYYDPTTTRAVAERLCAVIDEKFRVEIDGFRDTPVGPHPIANVLVIFKPDQFERVVPYLMLNRDGLDVLVHPLTEDAVEDHSSTRSGSAIWSS
ncbi:MAG TPA: DOPA 4,5-dioxygenase family protein [Stellaceae bacterium]|nr:DOPA 4,5-dioxygenase family protein [Stellaceae bacterium]